MVRFPVTRFNVCRPSLSCVVSHWQFLSFVWFFVSKVVLWVYKCVLSWTEWTSTNCWQLHHVTGCLHLMLFPQVWIIKCWFCTSGKKDRTICYTWCKKAQFISSFSIYAQLIEHAPFFHTCNLWYSWKLPSDKLKYVLGEFWIHHIYYICVVTSLVGYIIQHALSQSPFR